MLNECIPYYEGPYTRTQTVYVGYNVTGKTFVGPLTSYQGQGPALAADPLPTNDGGNLQAPSAPAAGGQVSGVAMWDAATPGRVTIIRGDGTFLPVTSGAAVNAGDLLKVDTQGRVVTAAQTAGGTAPANWIVGKAHSTVGAANNDVVVELLAGFFY